MLYAFFACVDQSPDNREVIEIQGSRQQDFARLVHSEWGVSYLFSTLMFFNLSLSVLLTFCFSHCANQYRYRRTSFSSSTPKRRRSKPFRDIVLYIKSLPPFQPSIAFLTNSPPPAPEPNPYPVRKAFHTISLLRSALTVSFRSPSATLNVILDRSSILHRSLCHCFTALASRVYATA